jgi:hypothetical protein
MTKAEKILKGAVSVALAIFLISCATFLLKIVFD